MVDPRSQQRPARLIYAAATMSVIAALVSIAFAVSSERSSAPSSSPRMVSLSGTAAIPLAPMVIVEAAPGAVLTLPNKAPAGTVVSIVDRFGAASDATAIAVEPSADATLPERSIVRMTSPYEAVHLRKTIDASAWLLF